MNPATLETRGEITRLRDSCDTSLDKKELIAILEEHLAVTDEWGGCKLASWQYGHNVLVDGIDAAADAIIAHLNNKAK
jgi:hypothetical protein